MTIEQKAKAYDKALERARALYSQGAPDSLTLESMFPELTESEDERVRKEIIDYIKIGTYHKDWISWLEKQGSEPNWCHHKVDLSDCSEEYRKAYYDGWNNCNMQHSQCKSELNDVVKCLINGMKFYYEGNEEATWGTGKWSMPVKHIIEVLEKQGEQNPTEWSLPYGKNETAEKLIALAECLEADGDCLFNGLSGNDYGKFLRVLAIELTKVKPAAWSEEDMEMLNSAISFVEHSGFTTIGKGKNNVIAWLKSLKQRIGG